MTLGNTFRGKRVLVTGHTGFKGSWLCHWLTALGARVYGYALAPQAPSLYAQTGLDKQVDSTLADIRDYDALRACFARVKPELVLHLAAQPLVFTGYALPRYTYDTNVMGSVNLLDCIAATDSVRAVVLVTTDKVYAESTPPDGYTETDALDGADPYANSKSCVELATATYRRALLHSGVAVCTARAGNVIGGGDYAAHRLLVDCVAAARQQQPIVLRQPHAVRPYQHVLDALRAYLLLLTATPAQAGAYNIGPDAADCLSNAALADLFCAHWGDGARWIANPAADSPPESAALRLNCDKLKATFGWQPVWRTDRAVAQTVAFAKAEPSAALVAEQLDAFLSDAARR